MQSGEERREFQRLRLDPPVPGNLGPLLQHGQRGVFGVAVSLAEIGVLGGRVRHTAPLGFSACELRFAYGGEEIAMRCEVVWTTERGSEVESGLRFVAALGESGDRLRTMLAKLVAKALEESQSQTLAGIDHVDSDKIVRGSDAGYLSYSLELPIRPWQELNSQAGVWHCRHVFLPEQPAAGFTVARSEDSEEMQRLCRVYQASNEEGRRLIRMFAELSVSQSLNIPPTDKATDPNALMRPMMLIVVVVAAALLLITTIEVARQHAPLVSASLQLANPLNLLCLGCAVALTQRRSRVYYALLVLSAVLSIVLIASGIVRLVAS